jgi:CubicO group peptidase (beta-lactamase class C family)
MILPMNLMPRPLLFLLASTAFAADPQALARIQPRLQSHVDRGAISGTVTLLLERGQRVHFETTGWADIDAKKPMRKDSIFQIMSMTKPFTGTAILMLAEEGKLNINSPVGQYLPEFKLHRSMTVRHLMTHTSGMSENPPGDNIEWYRSMKITLADAVKYYATTPLLQEPGTKWVYSNMGLATLGRIVEAVSGKSYEDFIAERILAPLAMNDTFFFPDRQPAERKARIVVNYCTVKEKLAPCGHETLGGDSRRLRAGAMYSAPEFGLYSTAEDLSRFYQTMLNGGAFNGKRLLSRASVQAMSMNQTGDLQTGHNAGATFGLTWEVIAKPPGTAGLWSLGTFGHGGAFGTHGWIDPAKQLVGVFLVQGGYGAAEAKANFIAMASSSVD